MKKYYSLICALLLAQGAMAIDYDQLKKSSKINAASKIELSKLQTQEEKTVVQSKATGSRLKALQKQMDNPCLRRNHRHFRGQSFRHRHYPPLPTGEISRA